MEIYRSRMYNIETKLVLFKLSCYKFKTFIIIPKITTKKIEIQKKRKEKILNGTKKKIPTKDLKSSIGELKKKITA